MLSVITEHNITEQHGQIPLADAEAPKKKHTKFLVLFFCEQCSVPSTLWLFLSEVSNYQL